MDFFLGAHHADWLTRSTRPLCITDPTLRKIKTLPRATCDVMIDSGGFSELAKHGRWTVGTREYAQRVRRYRDDIGRLQFAATQDWMCEPKMLAKTGLTVDEHQDRTIDNYIELMSIAPDLPWMPTIQGWLRGDYAVHIAKYRRRGVELDRLPRVGVGSVCVRPDPIRVSLILNAIADGGIRVHAFGVKAKVLELCGGTLASSDSMAWSFHARRERRSGRTHENPNGLETAELWAQNTIDRITGRGFCTVTHQMFAA